jgi:hypothetical protein
MATGSAKKEKLTNSVVVVTEFIGCEQKGIRPDTDGLQKMLKRTIITVNA